VGLLLWKAQLLVGPTGTCCRLLPARQHTGVCLHTRDAKSLDACREGLGRWFHTGPLVQLLPDVIYRLLFWRGWVHARQLGSKLAGAEVLDDLKKLVTNWRLLPCNQTAAACVAADGQMPDCLGGGQVTAGSCW
jgi:hypothetical protein